MNPFLNARKHAYKYADILMLREVFYRHVIGFQVMVYFYNSDAYLA